MSEAIADYRYDQAGATWANSYLWPVLEQQIKLRKLGPPPGQKIKAFDLGCGNGATSHFLSAMGFDVTGVDPSHSGIEIAQRSYPGCRFATGSAYDELSAEYGRFPLVVSLEVVEHCYDPRKFARTVFDLVEAGGTAMISTPYHGYLKNVALAVSGRLDSHFTALWDGGHVKFFSIRTLQALLFEAGFTDIDFIRVGRIGPLAKSMMAVARKT